MKQAPNLIESRSQIDAVWFRVQQDKLGLSNSEMARELCCDVSHVGHLRNGRRAVTESMKKLIGLL